MTVSAEDTKEALEGDGATLAWPFDFRIDRAEDLLVFYTSYDGAEPTLELGSDYSVVLHDNQDSNPGGTVTTVLPIPAGVPFIIMRGMVIDQLEEFDTSVPPNIISRVLDRLTQYALQLRERLDRSLHVSAATQSFADVNLRNVQTRRGKLIGFDDDGNARLLAVSNGRCHRPARRDSCLAC